MAAPKKVALAEPLRSRVRLAMNLGRTTARTGYGLSFGSDASLELRRAYATLVLAADGVPSLHPPGEIPPLDDDDEAVQLPLIADRGVVLPRARRRGARRLRAAICVTPFGRLLYAEVEHDSDDALAMGLLRAGCSRVALADRGSRHEAFLHAAGIGRDPSPSYETTVLFGLARAAVPYGFEWQP
jgi:hypothetical protein